MCMICVDFQKDKLTAKEATRNLREMRESIGEEHAKEVEQMIVEWYFKKFIGINLREWFEGFRLEILG